MLPDLYAHEKGTEKKKTIVGRLLAYSLYFNHVNKQPSTEGLESESISTARLPGLLNFSPSVDCESYIIRYLLFKYKLIFLSLESI